MTLANGTRIAARTAYGYVQVKVPAVQIAPRIFQDRPPLLLPRSITAPTAR